MNGVAPAHDKVLQPRFRPPLRYRTNAASLALERETEMAVCA